MGPMDLKAAKSARAHTPSPSDTSDDINFTGCEKARKILMALRGKPIPDGNNRDQVISIGCSSVPRTANTIGLPASGSSREGKAASVGRASSTASQATKGKRLRIAFLSFYLTYYFFCFKQKKCWKVTSWPLCPLIYISGLLLYLQNCGFSSVNSFILEESDQLDLFLLDPHDEGGVSTSHLATGSYKTSKDNRSKGYFPGSQ
jgi:hypothetical protein